MWIRLQASARCVACSEITAVNAALSALSCDGCGAVLTVREALWQSALDDVRAAAEALDANTTTTRTFDAQGLTLTLAAANTPPRCPHCDATWATDAPPASCASCGVAVSAVLSDEAARSSRGELLSQQHGH